MSKINLSRKEVKSYNPRPLVYDNVHTRRQSKHQKPYNPPVHANKQIVRQRPLNKPKPLINDFIHQPPAHSQPSQHAALSDAIQRSSLPLRKTKEPLSENHNENTLKHRRSKKGLIIYSTTLVLIITAIATNLLVFKQSIPNNTQAQVSQNGNNSESDNTQQGNSVDSPDVDETEPTKQNYQVAPDLPKYLSVDSLGVFARVLRVGVNSQNEILTPNNIHDVGWYDGSSKPGENGAVFINGHVTGPTANGVFYNLKKMKPGDIITIENGDSSKRQYRVVEKETLAVDRVDMNKVLRSIDVDKQGLNLMTCGGEFDKSSDSYKQRVIVYSVAI